MKVLNWVMAVATTAALSTGSLAADKTETPVMFRVLANNHHITTSAKGGLVTSSRAHESRQTFVLVDLNGGELSDGDSVQIKWAPTGAKPTYWAEGEGKVYRIGGRPTDACKFTVKLKETAKDAPQNVLFKTAGGKFMTAANSGNGLETTEAENKASTLEVKKVVASAATGAEE